MMVSNNLLSEQPPRRCSGVEILFKRLALYRYNKKRKAMKLDDFLAMHSRELFMQASTEVYYELMQSMFDDEKSKLVGCAVVKQYCGSLLP